MVAPGRWNIEATPVIYAARSDAAAMLEKLVHFSLHLPPNQHAIEITIPRGTSYSVFQPAELPGWDGPDDGATKAYGAAWVRSRRSAILLVPSIVARMEENVVINPAHAEFPTIEHDLPRPVWWDRRLFGQ